MDDSDINTTTKTWQQKTETENLQGSITYAGNVFSPAWVRRSVQSDNGFNWLVLDSRRRFLLYFRLFLASVYIIVEILK